MKFLKIKLVKFFFFCRHLQSFFFHMAPLQRNRVINVKKTCYTVSDRNEFEYSWTLQIQMGGGVRVRSFPHSDNYFWSTFFVSDADNSSLKKVTLFPLNVSFCLILTPYVPLMPPPPPPTKKKKNYINYFFFFFFFFFL